VVSTSSPWSEEDVGGRSCGDGARDTEVRREAFEVLERRLGGEVGQEENASAEKKSAVKERDEDGRSREMDC